jgi:hypothetical protein
MTRLLCAQAPRTSTVIKELSPPRWSLYRLSWVACILHSCSRQTSNDDCQRARQPASPRRKGFPSNPRFVRRGRSRSNETVISRSICAKLIKRKAKESVCYRHCPCGSRRRSVERRQKQWSLVREVRQPEPWPQEHRESNQRNPLAPI